MLKHLRITVTVLSLTACVLLIVLWVRNYHSLEALSIPLTPQRAVQVGSALGSVAFALDETGGYPSLEIIRLQFEPDEAKQLSRYMVPQSPWGGLVQAGAVVVLWVPNWLILLVLMILAALVPSL